MSLLLFQQEQYSNSSEIDVYSNREAIWLFKRAHWITNDHFKRHSVTYEWPLNTECPFETCQAPKRPFYTLLLQIW